MNKLTAITAATVAAAALVLTGCSDQPGAAPDDGGTSTEASQAAVDVNDADVSFAQNMVPHHQQAVEMSDLLLAKDGVAEPVTVLAEDIKAAQEPEIEQMNTWLQTWGAETGGGMDHGDMGHDMGHGDGMMTEEDMADLEAAPGPEASSLFLEQMIEHHEGAVAMAQEQVEQGQHPDAVALAEKMVTDQESEIEEMRGLLATL
ncbi:DUF305 domain-containing protein [Auraticoccus monumenti]|uniref:Uncharacterized conserved protein, DUF305 family n=1 Tax=Auraticoccus monumenti TaxID=675864 RepID=A0A1G6S9D5_9ACTN|nr:DUF305 domain-containing protein [Auraticoccus monumenti]SDD13343.1 Uncharacterized conserved protein, DUF305 family [Auraticoccus monumenti]